MWKLLSSCNAFFFFLLLSSALRDMLKKRKRKIFEKWNLMMKLFWKRKNHWNGMAYEEKISIFTHTPLNSFIRLKSGLLLWGDEKKIMRGGVKQQLTFFLRIFFQKCWKTRKSNYVSQKLTKSSFLPLFTNYMPFWKWFVSTQQKNKAFSYLKRKTEKFSSCWMRNQRACQIRFLLGI